MCTQFSPSTASRQIHAAPRPHLPTPISDPRFPRSADSDTGSGGSRRRRDPNQSSRPFLRYVILLATEGARLSFHFLLADSRLRNAPLLRIDPVADLGSTLGERCDPPPLASLR